MVWNLMRSTTLRCVDETGRALQLLSACQRCMCGAMGNGRCTRPFSLSFLSDQASTKSAEEKPGCCRTTQLWTPRKKTTPNSPNLD